jgi:hypothetical protein
VSYGFPIINFVIPEYIMKRPVLERQMLIAGQETADFMEHDLLTTERVLEL